jgi:preprotein translocase subunit YajC
MIHQKVDSNLALLKADEVNLEGGTKGVVTHLANQKLALSGRFRVTNL